MNSFTVVFLCIQACLVHNVFSQCAASGLYNSAALASPYGLGSPLAYGAGCAGRQPCPMGYPDTGSYASCPLGYGAGSSVYPGALGLAGPYGAASPYGNAAAPYGGAGEGNVAVAGQLPVKGNTAVTGQVPIMGAVQFTGAVPAAGSVSIAGQCACGCNAGPYLY